MSISKRSMALRVASLYIERIVLAAKIDTVLEKKKDLSDEEKKQIKELNDDLTNKAKYVDFLVKNYKEKGIVELINNFEKSYQKLKKKDINQYSIEELRNTLKSSKPTKTEVKRSGAKKLYEDDDILLLEILTKEASCYYGSGTKWCISGKEGNRFDQYYDEGNIRFYFLFNKTLSEGDPLSKIAAAVGVIETDFYDASDDPISENEVPFYNKIKKYLKPSVVYSGNFELTKEQVKNGIMQIPEIKKLKGDFNCFEKKLTSLEGAPKEVLGYFQCSNNNLTSLKGAPEIVLDSFWCSDNKLTSLKGAPEIVLDSFWCYSNKLTSLEGAPKEVGGSFMCSDNNLTSLEGAPEKVGGSFMCSDNNLTSLKGAPKEVVRNFDCFRNNLTSLEGAPEKLDERFDCSDNKLTSLKGAPKKVGRDFICPGNPGKFTEEDVRAVCDVGGRIEV